MMDRIGFIFPLRQLHWWLGLAILGMAIVVAVLLVLERRRRNRLEQFVDADLAPRLLAGYDASLRRPMFWLTVLGCAALAVTFFQPHWGQAWQEMRRQSHDILICLDTSESMRAINPPPSRIDRAKQKIQSLLDMAPGDRFGLIVFSGASALSCPLTNDHAYLKSVLSAVNTDTLSTEGTDIAAALEEAVKTFEEEGERTGIVDKDTRAILLISDGEQVSGDAIEQAEAASEFARIYVIGVGDPNGAEVQLPEWMGRYVSSRQEKWITKLDEETLSKIALTGNGGYVRSTPDNSDIEQIFDHFQELSAYTSSTDIRFRLVNRYQWPLALAIFCFAAEGLWLILMPWIRAWRMRRSPGNSGLASGLEEDAHA